MSKKKRIKKTLETAMRYGQIDDGHHKMWVIDQMVRELTGKTYNEFVSDYELCEEGCQDCIKNGEPCGYEWETGIAP